MAFCNTRNKKLKKKATKAAQMTEWRQIELKFILQKKYRQGSKTY